MWWETTRILSRMLYILKCSWAQLQTADTVWEDTEANAKRSEQNVTFEAKVTNTWQQIWNLRVRSITPGYRWVETQHCIVFNVCAVWCSHHQIQHISYILQQRITCSQRYENNLFIEMTLTHRIWQQSTMIRWLWKIAGACWWKLNSPAHSEKSCCCCTHSDILNAIWWFIFVFVSCDAQQAFNCSDVSKQSKVSCGVVYSNVQRPSNDVAESQRLQIRFCRERTTSAVFRRNERHECIELWHNRHRYALIQRGKVQTAVCAVFCDSCS